ncbi:hypothetical protein L1049_016866 [Liquidambar formosana]|uniref:Uncharacterized protein n=1 Tax=Liquidambar formosana TaxID=63359 RepID=A0AAP0S715_LIQFO
MEKRQSTFLRITSLSLTALTRFRVPPAAVTPAIARRSPPAAAVLRLSVSFSSFATLPGFREFLPQFHILLWGQCTEHIVGGELSNEPMSNSYPYKVWYRRHTPHLFDNPVHQEGGSIVELLTQRLSSIHDLSYTVLHTAHGEDEYVAALDRIRQICIQTLETINEQQLLPPSIGAAADDPHPSDQPGTSTPFPEPSSSYVPSPSVEPFSPVRPPGPYGHSPSVGQYAVKDILESNEAESHMGGGYISQQQLVMLQPAVVRELPVQARGQRRVKGRGRGRVGVEVEFTVQRLYLHLPQLFSTHMVKGSCRLPEIHGFTFHSLHFHMVQHQRTHGLT